MSANELAAPSSADGRVRAGLIGSLKAFLSHYPVESPDRFIRESGLEPDSLDDPEAMLSLSACLALLERAARVTGDDCFGVAFGAQVPWKDLGVLAYLMLHSPNLGSALENASRYFGVQQTLGEMTLSRGPNASCLTYALDHPELGPARQHSELVLFLVVRFCREATGHPDWAPLNVDFTHGGPANTSPLQHAFGVPVRFNRPESALVIPTAELELPVQMADPALLPILRRHAEECLSKARSSGNFSNTVRRLVAESLRSGDVAIEDIASKLDTSARSLQRRLGESGKTYQELLGETRLALSQRYLDDPSLSLTETAFLLGYSDLSAFSRAFRRWTGKSPLSYRRNRS